MLKEELENRIRKAVADYILDEETYDDNAQLCINPSTKEVYVEDSREVDVDSPDIDCYDVMDFVEMTAASEGSGKWKVNEEAVKEAAAEYVTE